MLLNYLFGTCVLCLPPPVCTIHTLQRPTSLDHLLAESRDTVPGVPSVHLVQL